MNILEACAEIMADKKLKYIGEFNYNGELDGLHEISFDKGKNVMKAIINGGEMTNFSVNDFTMSIDFKLVAEPVDFITAMTSAPIGKTVRPERFRNEIDAEFFKKYSYGVDSKSVAKFLSECKSDVDVTVYLTMKWFIE